ncbi:MAG: T9SS type A sorting domain-containing protein [Bacteroidota bacterium]
MGGWTEGTGSIPGFIATGNSSDNIRQRGPLHLGNPEILWFGQSNQYPGNCGGWSSSSYTINNGSSYRLTVWMKNIMTPDATAHFGTYSYASGSHQTKTLSGTTIANPKFFSGHLPVLDRWYLLVAYVHNKSYASTISHGKIYDAVTGLPVINLTDYKFSNSATKLSHITYFSNDISTNNKVVMALPVLELANGFEAPVETLLNINSNSKLLFAFDNSGNQKQRFYCFGSDCNNPPNPPAGRAYSIPDKSNSEVVEATNENVVLYPNPTNGRLSLKFSPEYQLMISSIKIYNMNSVMIASQEPREELFFDFNLANQSSGLYLLHIEFSDGRPAISKKIIKE